MSLDSRTQQLTRYSAPHACNDTCSLTSVYFLPLFFPLSVQVDASAIGVMSQDSFNIDPEEGLQHLLGSPGAITEGYQVIIPGMQFDCYGYVTNWSALAVLHTGAVKPAISVNLNHRLYFQLWRPLGNGVYQRVDDDRLLFDSRDIDAGELDMTRSQLEGDLTYAQFTGKIGEEQNRMYFQPGDVVGLFIPPFFGTNANLGLTFRTAAVAEEGVSVEMYSVSVATDQLCEFSECGENVTYYEAVVPQISVSFGKANLNALSVIYSCSAFILCGPCVTTQVRF